MLGAMKHTPCVKLILPFIGGILCEPQITSGILSSMIILTAILFVLFIIPFVNMSYRYRWVRGVVILMCFFWLGKSLHSLSRNHTSYNEIQSYNRLGIVVLEHRVLSSGKHRILGEIKYLDSIETYRSGKVLLYMPDMAKAQNLVYGDLIFMDNTITPIAGPLNRYMFDFKKFWERKSVYYQAFPEDNQWMPAFTNMGNPLIRMVHKIQLNILKSAEKDGITGDNKAIFSALFLGNRVYLDEGTRHSWANAGAIHVLAVSGLHVGIIYIILSSFCRALFRNRKYSIAGTLIVVLVLWLYACFTGFSVSVLRAVTMFTFIAVGKSVFRYVNIYNIIAASALLILIVDPKQLFTVGFQLSYLAVTGIVTFYPYLYVLVQSNNWFIDKIWQLTCVSITAQLSTFPLTIYYFHQFPVLFILTNLIIIPLATFIIYGSLIYIVCIPFDLSTYIAKLLVLFLKSSNSLVETVERIKFSTLHQLSITQPGLVILYCLIGFLIFFLVRKHSIWFGLAGLMLIIYLVNDIVVEYRSRNENKLVFFYDKYKVHVGIIRHKELKTLFINTDYNPGKMPFNLDYFISSSRYRYARDLEIVHLSETNNYTIAIDSINMYILNNTRVIPPALFGEKLQYLVLNRGILNPNDLSGLSEYQFKVITNYCYRDMPYKHFHCMHKKRITFFEINVK